MSAPEEDMGASALAWHAGAFVAGNLLLVVLFFVNKGRMALQDIHGIFDYWPLYVHVAWGILLAVHVVVAKRHRMVA